MARGHEATARAQEEIPQANQRAAATNLHNPTHATLVMEIPIGTPVGIPPLVGVGSLNPNVVPDVNPLFLEVDNQDNIFFSPRDESVFDAFGPVSTEIERKVCAIEEKLKAMDGSNTFGLDISEICLVPGIQIPYKFKVPNFEKYKGISYPRTHIREYCRNMAAHSNDVKLLTHFF
ncbi:uncharacterized protein LOC127136501 [Lathyrus oleraceus]|uniref:uncharacterized protein LOC127136501 n=1 Tax=Pisum sativum TaxID=3888 RepID=UPI0021D04A08|nr:uncharacterized protein LOC127136501 [Pisum sativum]